jgi:transketolase
MHPEMHVHGEQEVRSLHRLAWELRLDALRMVHNAGFGHLGGPFSVAEIMAVLLFHHLRIDPQRPDWDERDRFILSKGHASPLYYAALARRGFFPTSELMTFRKLDSRLNGHPDRKIPGVEMAAGPLGHGVAVGTGMALGLRSGSDKPGAISAPSVYTSKGRVYVLLGDGELNAGVIWEGVMAAAKYKLGNLKVIVDANGVQQTGTTSDVMPTEPLVDKWRSFGWHVQECGGHSIAELLDAFHAVDEIHGQPAVLIARTTKGKGVSFFEYDHRFHGGSITDEQFQRALDELEEGLSAWQN